MATAFAALLWLWCELQFIEKRRAYMQVCRDNGIPCTMATEYAQLYPMGEISKPTIPIWRRWLGDEAVLFMGHPHPAREHGSTPTEQAAYYDVEQRLFPEAKIARLQLIEERSK